MVANQKAPAGEPIVRWEKPVSSGKVCAAAKIINHRNVVVSATALARMRLGKISDIISHGSAPSARPCGTVQSVMTSSRIGPWIWKANTAPVVAVTSAMVSEAMIHSGRRPTRSIRNIEPMVTTAIAR